jgi:predicted transposase YdaD
MELVETVIIYKFPKLGREEIEKMLGLSDLKETKVYKEGRAEEAQVLVFRLLARRVGTLPPTVEAQVQALELPQLEALGEALLDFKALGDLTEWLRICGA